MLQTKQNNLINEMNALHEHEINEMQYKINSLQFELDNAKDIAANELMEKMKQALN